MEWNFDIFQKELAGRLRGISPDRIVFVGVGNRLRGDDAIGPTLIDLIKGRVPHAIDAGNAPENVTSAIKRMKPQAVVILDATGLGDMPPGNARIIDAREIKRHGASTHNISLDAVMEYLGEETGADVFMVGVQPEKIGEGEGISPTLRKPLDELAEAIVDALKS